jgi:hypothetical protein
MAAQHVTLGLALSAPMPVKLQQEELDKLLAALPAAGWHDVSTEDGIIKLNLASVIYVKTDKDEQKIGFS